MTWRIGGKSKAVMFFPVAGEEGEAMPTPVLRRHLAASGSARRVDEVRDAMRGTGDGEDGVPVILQDFNPAGDVGGVVFMRFKSEELGEEAVRVQFDSDYCRVLPD
jgi:hypothetical protein